MVKKFYITTPIYYPNDIPHIGHAYTTVVADVLVRWNSLLGKDVFFLTGTDDHGKKIMETAEKAGKTPKEFVDNLVPKFKDAWKKLDIQYDKFIRTSDSEHEKLVQNMLQKSYDNGDIYLGNYEGLYCTGCEAYYTEKDLINNYCPIHKKPVEKIKEETYFFRLSKYREKLLELYKRNPNFISPPSRRQEVINRVEEGLKDLSVSRTSFNWGVPLPFDKKHVCYVWFDALFNYYSAVQEKGKEKFWPTDVHLIGKDILWFHAVYWPAFLFSVGIDLPKKIFAHGWWTFDKEKISKSVGRVINIDELISITGNKDSARYFLCRATPFGDDGDFSELALVDRHNNELSNKLGNLVSRVAGLIEKNGFEKCDNELAGYLHLEDIKDLMENFEVDKALNEIFSFIDRCNEYIQEKKPWETGDKKILYELADSIKKIAILLWPFIPSTSEKIAQKFGGFDFDLKELGVPLKNKAKIVKGENLFVKVENEMVKEKIPEKQKINKKSIPENIVTMEEIVQFGDWEKIDLRVAEIKKVDAIEGADKLWKMELDVGEMGHRTICAGLKEYYSAKDLKGKKIIYFSNLNPRKMKGVESQGMLLAASTKNHEKVVLIAPEKDIENGARIG
jgi:methionyl-tRNA synthetase